MRACLVVAILCAGCGETELGPFQALPIDTRLDVTGLDGVVHVARDRFGIAHVYARSIGDLGFGQGYVMAHDRLPQLDMLRRFASGTLAEVYGATAVPTDVEMRFHRIRRFAEDTWAELQASSAVRDQQVVTLLSRFSDGVNAYLDDLASGRWRIDPDVQNAGLYPIFAPAHFPAWTPVDSLAILRFFTFAQSWTVPEELDLTSIDLYLRAAHPGTGIERDVLALAPLTSVTGGATPPPIPATPRPTLPDLALLDRARDFFSRELFDGPAMPTLGPHAFMRPYIGSTAFAVGPEYTAQLNDGVAMVAADLEFALSNPSVLYPMHQMIAPSTTTDVPTHDVIGLMLPGVPVVVAGTNGAVGWVPTLGTADVNDVYLEQLQPCGTDTCSTFDGTPEPLGAFTEMIQIGQYGDITGSQVQTYEVVPRHGPIIPGGTATAALSIRSNAYAVSHELAALWELADTAQSVGDASTILGQVRHGPHWLLADRDRSYEWGAFVAIPERPAGARQWSATSPDGAAPFFILDGTAPDHEWTDRSATVPARSSDTEARLVVTDADPTAATLDGNPLDDTYTGVVYGSGLRDDRIAALIDATPRPVDAKALSTIHHDTTSIVGARLVGEVVRILGALDSGAPGDVAPYLASIGAKTANLTLARDVLAAWQAAGFDTPIGKVAADASSSATLLFNTWMFYFGRDVLADELATAKLDLATFDPDRLLRIVDRVLIDRASLAIDPATTEPRVCSAAVSQSCWKLVLQAAVEAVDSLTAESGGKDDWRWGRAHALTMTPLFDDPTGLFALPHAPETALQLTGDMFAIDRADGGWGDEDFTPRLNAAFRMVLVFGIDVPLGMTLELPTGTVLDRRDPHYRDLLEKTYGTRTPFTVPITLRDINDQGESRWELQ